AKCRGAPKTTSALATASRLASDRPAGPSSPRPMIESQGSDMTRILLLGGTTEASLMARQLAQARVAGVFSYAGRTERPVAQPLTRRVGGFGGVAGREAYLKAEGISHVIDATHPFAAQMSRNAIAACAQTGTPLIGLERAPWQAQADDHWQAV